nr:phage tail assembly chaperone [Erythrobacter sp. A6_0]
MRLSGLAARALGWTPPVFWAATPAELAACIGQEAADAAPPDRAEIAAMIERDRHG